MNLAKFFNNCFTDMIGFRLSNNYLAIYGVKNEKFRVHWMAIRFDNGQSVHFIYIIVCFLGIVSTDAYENTVELKQKLIDKLNARKTWQIKWLSINSLSDAKR